MCGPIKGPQNQETGCIVGSELFPNKPKRAVRLESSDWKHPHPNLIFPLVAFLFFEIKPIFGIGQPIFKVIGLQEHKSRHEKLNGFLNKIIWKNCENLRRGQVQRQRNLPFLLGIPLLLMGIHCERLSLNRTKPWTRNLTGKRTSSESLFGCEMSRRGQDNKEIYWPEIVWWG